MIFVGAMNGEGFRIRVNALVKGLPPGDPVIRDKLVAPKVSGIREILQKKGVDIRLLKPYAPDLDLIKNVIAQLKPHLWKVEAKDRAGSACSYRRGHKSGN